MRTSRSREVAFRALQVLSAATLFALMAVVATDVCGRYLFNRPLPAGYEMVQALMAVLVFGTLPLVSRRNDHIALGLVEQLRLAPAVERWRLAFVHLFSAGALAFVTWRLAVHASKLAEGRDATPVLEMPLAPLAWGMSALAGLSAGLLVLLAFRCFSQPQRS